MTVTRVVLLAMLVAVLVIAARTWWGIRTAERKRPR
jgi:preprotein translocase subunit Sec61beta